MATGVTSQWDDLQVKHGNYTPHEHKETLAENYEKVIEKIEHYDPLANKDLKQLEEIEDDFEKEFLDQYTQIRMKEMQDRQDNSKFGRVLEINREEYVDEVTNASRECFVVLHLYQDYVQDSVLMNQILEQVAPLQPTIKFVKMVATKASDKFPDSSVPCFLIYRNAKIVSNLPRVNSHMKKLTVTTVQYLLKSQGVISLDKSDLGDSDEEYVQQIKNPYKNSKNTNEDDPLDDREYSTNQKFYQKYM